MHENAVYQTSRNESAFSSGCNNRNVGACVKSLTCAVPWQTGDRE